MAGDAARNGLAIVTGAAGGMGSHCARQLAEDGWSELLLCDMDEGRLEAVAAPLREQGAKVEILAGEITDPAFCDKLLVAAGAREIGAVVHTAGVSPHMADRDRVLEINLDATQHLVDAIRPRMAEGGAAVLIASMAAHMSISPELDALFEQPLPAEGTAALRSLVPTAEAAYPLSKRGVIAMVKREAKGFGERKARIVSISPGLIDTTMMSKERNPQTDYMLSVAGLQRLGRPEEIADLAVFLCSPKASFITGCDILIDGGVIAGMGL